MIPWRTESACAAAPLSRAAIGLPTPLGIANQFLRRSITSRDNPMTEVIEPVRLPDEVRVALLDRAGRMGHLLRVVEALERTNDASVSELLAEGNPCTTSELPQLQIAALT
jgi:c-di-GMP-related signal transduction protein